MSKNRILAALNKSARELLDRGLTESEITRLEAAYDKALGSRIQRATSALGKITGMSPNEIRQKRASDDNADRAIRDLESLLDE